MTKIPVTTPFTVEEFKEKLSEWQEEHFEDRNLFLECFWQEGVPTDYIDEMPTLDGIGKLDVADFGGGEGDGAEIYTILSVGGRFFRRSGYYSSWGDSTMDGPIHEVFPREVTRTEYFTEKE